MEQALVLAGGPVVSAGTAAADAGICIFGAAICSLTGVFAAGWAASELNSVVSRKRKLEQIAQEVSDFRIKARKLQRSLKVSEARTRRRFKKQATSIRRKSDITNVAEQMKVKVGMPDIDNMVRDTMAACSEDQECNSGVTVQQSSSNSCGANIIAACSHDAGSLPPDPQGREQSSGLLLFPTARKSQAAKKETAPQRSILQHAWD